MVRYLKIGLILLLLGGCGGRMRKNVKPQRRDEMSVLRMEYASRIEEYNTSKNREDCLKEYIGELKKRMNEEAWRNLFVRLGRMIEEGE